MTADEKLDLILKTLQERTLPKVHLGVWIPNGVGKLCEAGGPSVFTLDLKLVTCARCKGAIERRALAKATEDLSNDLKREMTTEG